MKKYLFALAVIFLIMSCNSQSGKYRLVKEMKDGSKNIEVINVDNDSSAFVYYMQWIMSNAMSEESKDIENVYVLDPNDVLINSKKGASESAFGVSEKDLKKTQNDVDSLLNMIDSINNVIDNML